MVLNRRRPVNRQLSMLCWAVYFCTYLGRLSYSAALSQIILAQGLTKGQAGMIGTGFFIAYGVGQLISGFLADRMSPIKLIFAGTVLSAGTNIMFALLRGYVPLVILWAINGVGQSLVWSPIVQLFGKYFSQEERDSAIVHVSTSGPAGTLVAYGLTALFIKLTGNWRIQFFISGAALLIIAFVWLLYMGRLSHKLEPYMEEKPLEQSRTAVTPMQALLASVACICAALFMQGMLKDGITTWVPTYLSENFTMDGALSIVTTAIIPLCNLFGVYLATIARKLVGDEMHASSVLFGISVAAVLALYLFGIKSAGVSILLLALITTLMMAVNTLLVSIVPGYFAVEGRAASVSGVLNACAYAGCAVSSYGFGMIANAFGWNATIFSWLVIGAAGALVSFAGKNAWLKKKSALVQSGESFT